MPAARTKADVVIVGAGVAGVSAAYFLAQRGITNVVVLEREAHAAHHASGRSAATLVELDPVPAVQRLKILGGHHLRTLPDDFAENPVLEKQGVLALCREPDWSILRKSASGLQAEGLNLRLLSAREANARVGDLLAEEEIAGAALLPDDGFIDVHELLSSYMRHARRGGVEFRFGMQVTAVVRRDGRCGGVKTSSGTIESPWVVNAGGAWVGEIAAAAGASPIRFAPLRRSLVVFAPPDGVDSHRWPLVWSAPHSLYFRPETTGILFCPMDETPMAPCDAQPGDVEIAAGLERLRALAPALVPRTLGRRWGGLRTFSPDRVPVVGEDPRLPGFFWLAGQGGCGIETSPALGRIAADLLATGATERFDAALLSPARFDN